MTSHNVPEDMHLFIDDYRQCARCGVFCDRVTDTCNPPKPKTWMEENTHTTTLDQILSIEKGGAEKERAAIVKWLRERAVLKVQNLCPIKSRPAST